MKTHLKKLFLVAALGLAAVAITPRAQAGQYARVYAGSDYCGRPAYTYVPKAYLYGDSYTCAPRYDAPVYVDRDAYGSRCAPVRRHYSRPRISFSFGF